MTMTDDQALRKQLVKLLDGRQAHVSWEDVLTDFPPAVRGSKPEGAPHTPWQLLEHLRIAQWDILEFSRDPGHVSPDYPKEYWPKEGAPPDAGAWDRSVARFRDDLAAMKGLVADPSADLFTPFAHGTGQNLLREALLAADHNAYHLGQLVLLRRLLGAWSAEGDIEGLG
jgi:hypothetical protein